MKILKTFSIAALTCSLSAMGFAAGSADTDGKVDGLLAQMTLDEKVGQMTQVDMDALQNLDDIQKYFLGSMLSGGGSDPTNNLPATWQHACRDYEDEALKTRLKI